MAEAWKRFRRSPVALGAGAILVFILMAIGAPWLAPFDPAAQFFDGLTLQGAPLPPSGKYLLGTDLLGRDLLSRLIFGARDFADDRRCRQSRRRWPLGAFVGITAGYLQGPVGFPLMRFTDLMMAFPALLLAIALAAIFEPSLWIVAMVIAMVNWVQVARIVYTETTLAGRARLHRGHAGAGRALAAHRVPPHPAPSDADSWWCGARSASPPPCCSRRPSPSSASACARPRPPGATSSIESQSYFLTAPWLVFFPGAAILLLALSFNIVGDALRDAFDPTASGRRR